MLIVIFLAISLCFGICILAYVVYEATKMEYSQNEAPFKGIKITLLMLLSLALIASSPSQLYVEGYKRGQINALIGKVDYKLQKNDLSEDVWIRVLIEKKEE
jgi:heme/copper-type cytochrome/quinol oxidase subunit 3